MLLTLREPTASQILPTTTDRDSKGNIAIQSSGAFLFPHDLTKTTT